MTITTFDKLSPQDQSLVRLAMQYRDNAYTPYSHHQVGASVRTASGTCYGGCNVEVISLQTTCHAERNAVMNMAIHDEEGGWSDKTKFHNRNFAIQLGYNF